MTDPIADMLTRIRNASRTKKEEVFVPFSKIKLEIVKILKREGYVADFDEIKPDSSKERFGGIMVKLKYIGKEPAITSIKKISRPGRRIYSAKDELPKVLNNLGIAIISTSQGLMTNRQAKKAGLGGEVICEIY
jgi:small subunit ribosomal protein S8